MAADRLRAGGLRGEEFAELIAILIEHRLGAAEVVSHGQNLAADRLGVFAHIGVGHDQRLLDHGARAGREETVEAAVERGRGDHGDEHGRHRGDNGEQADDLDVKARAGAAAPARLDDDPDFAPDNGEQQKPGDGIAEEKLDDHLVDRRDRGQAGEHQEGRGRRQQRDADRDRPDQPRGDRHRCGGRRIERGDLIDSRH